MYIHTYTHAYIPSYTHIHTHRHTYIHTQYIHYNYKQGTLYCTCTQTHKKEAYYEARYASLYTCAATRLFITDHYNFYPLFEFGIHWIKTDILY